MVEKTLTKTKSQSFSLMMSLEQLILAVLLLKNLTSLGVEKEQTLQMLLSKLNRNLNWWVKNTNR